MFNAILKAAGLPESEATENGDGQYILPVVRLEDNFAGVKRLGKQAG